MYLTPIKAIRAKCLDCCCGNTAEVRRCPAVNCTLHPYRMGKRPKQDGNTPEAENDTDPQENPHFHTAEIQRESPLV